MIAVWMLYCLGIGAAFVVVGHALERALHFAGRPTRWAWVIAIVGTYMIPVVAWLRPEAFDTFPVPAVLEQGPPSTSASSIGAAVTNQAASRSFALSDLDTPLQWTWLLLSCGMLGILVAAAVRLATARRRWRRSWVDGRDVLVSPNVGPAVVGFWSPRVVLPAWTLGLNQNDRELMLAHEEQHVRAKDPALLAATLGAVLLAPWSLALWWQWRRLRLAVEIDCDARVLAHGRSAPAYGELLLRVSERRSARLVGVAAFGEPVSFLESRIRRLLGRLPRWRWAAVAIASLIGAGMIVAACEAPRPLVPRDAMAQESQRDRTTLHDTSWQRPYVRAAIRQFFPTLDDPNGPALDAYLIHDAQLRAYQGTLTQRGSDRIGAADLRRALPAYSTHDAWTVIDPATLRGIVRGNVRVIWVHHDPEPQDTMPTVEEQVRRLQPNMALSTVEVDSGVARQLEQKLEQLRWQQRDEALRALARQSEPAAFAAHTAIALIVDSENRLVAHTSGIEEPGRRSCVDVVKRLLPAYRNTQFAISGCMITDPKNGGVVYWGQVSNR